MKTGPRIPYWLFFLIPLLGILFWAVSRPTAPHSLRFHLFITGITKGRYVPYQNNFPPNEGELVGGISYLVPLLNTLRQAVKSEPQALISLGGEISGSPEAYFTKGEFVIHALNLLAPQAVLVGNMEFTFGAGQLRTLVGQSRFPWVSSNVVMMGTEESPDYIVPEVIIQPAPGVAVAILGLTPPATAQMTMQSNITGLKFLSPGPELNLRIQGLRNRGVQVIILASQYHTGSLSEMEWLAIRQAKPDVFLMLDFTHLPPDAVFRDGILVKYLNGYNHGREVDHLTLGLEGSPLTIRTASATRHTVLCSSITLDPEVEQQFLASRSRIDEIRNEVIATFAEDIVRQYVRECPLGNLITDAMRRAVPCDLALQNSGGVQSNVRAGKFTLGDLYKVLPFDNELVTMELSGSHLQELFIQAASQKRGVLQISGGSYRFSHRGENDFDVREILINHQPLLATATYTITTNTFLAEGGDEFHAFRRGKNLRIGPPQRETVQKYLTDLSAAGPIPARLVDRIQSD